MACALALASGMAAAQQTAGTGELEEIVVTGSQIRLPEPYAGGQVAQGGRVGILGNLELLDTPFAGTNYTADLMLNQQADGVSEALLNDPFVRAAQGFGNTQEVYLIRGYPAFSDDMTYNGIYGILPRQFVASELLERVEVFRGASAFLNGAAPGGSNLGGAINLVPKRAPDEPLTRMTAGYESTAAAYVAADVGRRFGTDQATGIRANAAWRNGETSIEDVDRDLTVLSFGVDHRGERLRLAADIGYQDQHIDEPRPQVTPIGGIPDPPSAEDNFAQPWTYSDEEQLFGVARAEYDLTNTAAVWAAFGLRDGEERNRFANPNATPDGATTSSRFDNFREDEVSSGELGLRWDFETGPVGHRIIVSGSTYSLESRNAYAFSNFFAPFASDLNDPIDVPPPPADFFVGGDLDNPHVTLKTDTTSYAIADSLRFADGRFLLTVGVREQNLENETFDYNTGDRVSHYDESKATPVGGLVFRPSESLSFYANYIEGLIPGDIPPTALFTGETVVNGGVAEDPYNAEQFEAGAKYDSGSFGATLSLFHITRPFGFFEPFDDPSTPGNDVIFLVDGEQRNQGVELSVYGEPVEGFRVLGGITYLDAELTQTQGGVNEGNTAVGSPETQANLNVEYDVGALGGLTLEARALYTSSQEADAANTLSVDSWTRFDVGARYATEWADRSVSIRARIDNVFNEDNWVSVGGFPGANYLVLGAPATLVLSASVAF
jgi:iron complex outermembrane receptor protein